MFNRVRRFVLFAIGASVPIQGVAFDAGGLLATPFKLAVAVLLVMATVQYAARSGGSHRDRKTLWIIGFAVSFFVGTVMALVAGLPPAPVLRSSTTMIALISFYLLLGYAVDSKEDIVRLLWGLAFGGAFTVLPAVVGLQQSQSVVAYGHERFSGLSGQENLLGADMCVVLAASAGLFFIARSKVRRAILIGIVTLATAGIALSLSRSAFLALGFMWGLWLYRSGSRGNLQYAVLAGMLAIVSLAFLPESVMDRLGTIFDATERARDGSIQGRFEVGAWGIRAFMSNPIVGVGTPRFPVWVHEQPDGLSASWHTIHNAYIGIAAEQGLLGLVPFLAILTISWMDYTACWRAVRSRRLINDPVLTELGHLALFLQIALLSGLVGGMFHQQHRSKTMWLMMALSPIVLSLARERLEALRGPDEVEAPLFPTADEPHDPPHAIPASL
ncbi:MAG: O-antigen ligase family protein [Deltaproteobacteria bacterium]|nr:O-antigen ligase family protein [Deltaproteobacteria bacterium]